VNAPWLRWLLNLDRIPAEAEHVALVWERPWALWMWVILLIIAGGVAVWSYARVPGRRLLRGPVAVMRFAAVVLLLVLISGPMLQLERERIEEDWVIALLDRSASMTVADVDVDQDRRTRDAQLRDMLSDHRETFRTMEDERHLVWLGFDEGAFTLI